MTAAADFSSGFLRAVLTPVVRIPAFLVPVFLAAAAAGHAADSEAVWLPQSRRVHVSPESLDYPPEPAAPASITGARLDAGAGPASRPTDRRSDHNWRLRPVYERKAYDRSTIPGEDALNRPTALEFRL